MPETPHGSSEGSPPAFEEALARLEQVVHDLEDGQLGLAESLARYEEGIRCLKQCYRALDEAQRKIEILAGVDAQGQPIVEPLKEDSLSLEEKAEARSRRRSRTNRARSGDESNDDPGAMDGRQLF